MSGLTRLGRDLVPSLAVVAGLGLAPAHADSRIADLVSAVADASPAGEGLPSAAYSIGNLTLELNSGRIYPLTSGELTLGAFVTGAGTYRYRNTEPLAAANFEANVKRSTRGKVENGELVETFKDAWILDAAILDRVPDLAGSAGPAPEDAARELGRLRERFARDRVAPAEQLIAQALAENRPRDAVAVLISGGDDIRYVFDTLRSGEERLAVLERFASAGPLSGQRYDQTLINRPTGGRALDLPPRRWRLTAVDLTLVNPSDRRLELEVRETITAEVPLQTLAFELWDEVFDNAEWLPYEIEHVGLAGGPPVAWARSKREVLVELPRPLAAGESAVLEWRIRGDALVRPLGHSFWWLPLSPWLPLPDRLDMSHFTYRAVTKVAGDFQAFSIGRTVRRWQEGELACAEFELERPVQFATILAGSYNLYEETRDGLTIRLASYAFKRNDSMQRIANNTFELIELLEKLLGDFPFPELNILEINSFGFGIAPPGVIYLTREAFDPGPEGRRFRAELNHRMAHEVAHQWWGHVAQMNGWQEQWLSESTAEYYGAVAIGLLVGEHKFKAALKKWKEQAGWVGKADSVYYANLITGERAGRERYGLLYAQGPLVLHELRQELGDNAFFTIFKSLLRSFPFETVDTGTFIELTNYVTKKDYGPWIRERLIGAD